MSSTGLSSHTAALLAYSGWWMTGALFWFLERRDERVRFHAVQATAVFGAIAILIVLCGALGLASLSFLPEAFPILTSLAAGIWLGGVILWVVSIWKAFSGDEWRIPVAADWADRVSRVSAAASS